MTEAKKSQEAPQLRRYNVASTSLKNLTEVETRLVNKLSSRMQHLGLCVDGSSESLPFDNNRQHRFTAAIAHRFRRQSIVPFRVPLLSHGGPASCILACCPLFHVACIFITVRSSLPSSDPEPERQCKCISWDLFSTRNMLRLSIAQHRSQNLLFSIVRKIC